MVWDTIYVVKIRFVSDNDFNSVFTWKIYKHYTNQWQSISDTVVWDTIHVVKIGFASDSDFNSIFTWKKYKHFTNQRQSISDSGLGYYLSGKNKIC